MSAHQQPPLPQPEHAAVRRARLVGRVLQAAVLAALLSAALLKLLMYGSGVVFRYQGF
jgi:hypothetical protein